RAGGVASAEPNRHERRGEPGRLADDGGRTRVPEHPAVAKVPPGGTPRHVRARPGGEPRRRSGSRGPGIVGRLGRPRPARGPRDTLTPAERLAFVLHDMFDVPFDEIARSWDVHRRRLGSWRAAPVAVSRERLPSPTQTSTVNERSSMPFSRPPAPAISTP